METVSSSGPQDVANPSIGYLALGISGAFQHMAGIAGVGTVIAVNKDKKAPIFRAADYGAVADALDIVAALKTELHKNWPR
jgi:electron transfer flavoprotein alpha subunit